MALIFKKEKRKILNPKLLLLALVALIALVALPAFADDNGRYQMEFDSEDYVWVLDTKTGVIRICWMRPNNYTPMCGDKRDATQDGVVQ